MFIEGIVSVNIFDYVYWNSYAGYFHVLNAKNYTVVWGSGFEIFPKKMVSGVLEMTAETSLFRDNPVKELMNDVFRVTPAVKIHLPDMLNLMLGMGPVPYAPSRHTRLSHHAGGTYRGPLLQYAQTSWSGWSM